MKIINLLVYKVRRFLIFLALALQVINKSDNFTIVIIFFIVVISIYFFCQKVVEKRSLEKEVKAHLKEEERLLGIISDKNNLLEQVAYSLRLSTRQRITELIQDEYPEASFEYQKNEGFSIFKDGGRFFIDVTNCEVCDCAEVTISKNQEVTINFTEKETFFENFDTNFNLLENIECPGEEYTENLDDIFSTDDDSNQLDENQDVINKELELWFRDIGKAELENILSENKKLEVLIDKNGEILSLEKEKLGKLSFFPSFDKWENLKSIFSSFGLLIENTSEFIKVKVS